MKLMEGMKVYITREGINLYDVFKAGIGFCQAHPNHNWTEEEWYAALEAALPEDFLATLTKQEGQKEG
jgi:hypothetical protein